MQNTTHRDGPEAQGADLERRGLNQASLSGIGKFARDSNFDVIYIQETKWSEDSNWSNREFHYIHSAGVKGDKAGGVLTMVSTRIARRDDVQYLAVHVSGDKLLPVGTYHKADHMDFMHICEAMVPKSYLHLWEPNVITRQSTATYAAKKAGTKLDFPVAAWRDGARHYPVVAEIPMPSHTWHAQAPKPTAHIDTAQLIQDLQQREAPEALQLFRQEIQDKAAPDIEK
ncbi:betA [Symbiodinium sp. CCMP2592]|nr:betA [Symbiodinium sp. CCMP2592]